MQTGRRTKKLDLALLPLKQDLLLELDERITEFTVVEELLPRLYLLA